MTLLVGFAAGESGTDALALAVRLVTPAGENLLVAHVRDAGPGAAEHTRAHGDADTALADARRHLPDSLDVRLESLVSASAALGLTMLAEEDAVTGMVLGSGARGEFGAIHASDTADQLLHVSPVPVFLAPRGTAASDWALRRVTVCYQPTAGGRAALQEGIRLATACHVPLRLLTLAVTVPSEERVPALVSGRGADADTLAAAKAEANEGLGEARIVVGAARPRVVEPHTRVGVGMDTEAALRDAGWGDGDLLVCGSGRLGIPGRVFLGHTASRLMRAARTPVTIVPRPL